MTPVKYATTTTTAPTTTNANARADDTHGRDAHFRDEEAVVRGQRARGQVLGQGAAVRHLGAAHHQPRGDAGRERQQHEAHDDAGRPRLVVGPDQERRDEEELHVVRQVPWRRCEWTG